MTRRSSVSTLWADRRSCPRYLRGVRKGASFVLLWARFCRCFLPVRFANSRIVLYNVDTGDQTSSIGTYPTDKYLTNIEWVTRSDIPDQDRTFLWSAGLLGVAEFYAEVCDWGGRTTGYPRVLEVLLVERLGTLKGEDIEYK